MGFYMINTSFFEIIVLCLKIMFFSSNAQAASVDMLSNGKYVATFHYKMQTQTMVVIMKDAKKNRKMMKIQTIDNGLYSVKLTNESSFKIDLAQYFMKLNMKKMDTSSQRIKIKGGNWLKITPGSENVYFHYNKWTFVIHKKFLRK